MICTLCIGTGKRYEVVLAQEIVIDIRHVSIFLTSAVSLQ